MVSKKLNNMEIKLYLKENGKEIKVGDYVIHREDIAHPQLGKIHSETTILVTKESIPTLIKMGIIVPSTTPSNHIGCYISKALAKLGWTESKDLKYLQDLDNVYPTALFSILLREIAIELDKKYDDHIENSPEIFVVSTLDGRISKANKAHIKNYRNFAAFRSVADAKFACRILRSYLRDMYAKRK